VRAREHLAPDFLDFFALKWGDVLARFYVSKHGVVVHKQFE